MKLSLAISPCPNDTFMFDAMLNGRIDTEGLEFEVVFKDIEELNAGLSAAEGVRPHISKASYAVLPQVADRYCALRSGSALGRGNGPLLVAGDESAATDDCSMRIAVPGMHTTANLLMERLFPHLSDKRAYLFSDIPHIVGRGECDAGVLIHEGRFVYRRYGLFLLADLGVEWERATGSHRRRPEPACGGGRDGGTGAAPEHRLCLRASGRFVTLRPGACAGVGRRGDKKPYRILRERLFAGYWPGGCRSGRQTARHALRNVVPGLSAGTVSLSWRNSVEGVKFFPILFVSRMAGGVIRIAVCAGGFLSGSRQKAFPVR